MFRLSVITVMLYPELPQLTPYQLSLFISRLPTLTFMHLTLVPFYVFKAGQHFGSLIYYLF